MNSLTDDEQTTIDTYDKTAQKWSSAHQSGEYWRRQLTRFHELLPKGKVLEVGCGGGRDARELVALGYKYIGSDISRELLKMARKNVPGQKFVLQSIYELDFPDKFDGFWACAVLLHIPKNRIAEALTHLKSTLKKGSIGFISVKKGLGEKWIGDEGSQRFFSFWDKDEFSDLLKISDFEIIDFIHDRRSENDDWLCFFVKLK